MQFLNRYYFSSFLFGFSGSGPTVTVLHLLQEPEREQTRNIVNLTFTMAGLPGGASESAPVWLQHQVISLMPVLGTVTTLQDPRRHLKSVLQQKKGGSGGCDECPLVQSRQK